VTATSPDDATHRDGCLTREILDRIGDKWSVYVIDELTDGPRRFSDLRRTIDGISQRMLTVTLRGLERDGLVLRQMYPVIPPRVEYSLTPLGQSLMSIVESLVAWSASHISDVEQARHRYDTTSEQYTASSPA
jgi:DNA-binding HxlR family transcriptional regulator